jgi:RHS repeat-associated protein
VTRQSHPGRRHRRARSLTLTGPAAGGRSNLSSGTLTYLVSDRLGSIRGTVNASGSLASSTSYDAWGNPQTAGGLTSNTPFGYAGNYTDPTGLTYNIRRYYDPATGQFISVDPLVDQTTQPYSYGADDPIDNIDPSGLDICAFGVCVPTPSLQHVSDAVAGFGDMITFGGTAWARGQINNAFGLPNTVDYCSSWYGGGGYTGLGTSLFLGGYGLLEDAAEGGGILARLRTVDWTDETGSVRIPTMTQWGWTGTRAYRGAVAEVALASTRTLETVAGKIPTLSEAEMLIEDAGGTIERIEPGHESPLNPHTYPHINYITPAGTKATLQIASLDLP